MAADSCTVEQAVKMKKEITEMILRVIQEFEKTTGCVVEGVYVSPSRTIDGKRLLNLRIEVAL